MRKARKLARISSAQTWSSREVIFNQTVLKSVIETIIFCGCQALSLRCHRDDPQFDNSSLLEFPSVNVEIFLELIRFRVVAGGEIKKLKTF